MALITDYGSLKTEVIGWAHDDEATDSVVSTCVQLAETYLTQELRTVNQQQSTTLTLTAATQTVAAPTGFVEHISLNYADQSGWPKQVSQTAILDSRDTMQSSGRPSYYCINADNSFAFERPASTDYSLTLVYYKRFDLATDTTNWLLTNHPNVYFWATLQEVASYLRNQNLLQFCHEADGSNKRNAQVAAVIHRDARARRGATLRVDPALMPRATFDIMRGY